VTLVPLPLHRSTAVGGVKTTALPHPMARLGAQNRLGGVVSTMVTVWLQNATLLQASMARHVRVTLESFGHMFVKLLVTSANRLPPMRLLTMVMVTLVPLLQRSTAVGMSNAQSVPHCTSLSGPQARCGGWVSTTVKVWLQVAVLLEQSVTLQ